MLVVATSTITDFLSDTFGTVFATFLFALETILPYLLTIALVLLAWRIGKRLMG